MVEWVRHAGPMGGVSYALTLDDFYISYNPDTNASAFHSFFGGDGSGEETALVREEDGQRVFHILNGDWRDQFKEAAEHGGFDACLKLFDENKAAHGSSWSTRDEDRAA